MGDVRIADPTEFDVAVRDLDNQEKNGKLPCAGTLVNLRPRTLENLELRCAADRTHVVRIAELPARGSIHFEHTFDDPDHEGGWFEVWQAGKRLEVLYSTWDERMQRVLKLATDVYAATQLALEKHEVFKEFRVDLVAEPEFDARPRAKQQQAAAAAYRAYQALAQIYDVTPKQTLSLHIDVQVSDVAYDFDGETLTRYE